MHTRLMVVFITLALQAVLVGGSNSQPLNVFNYQARLDSLGVPISGPRLLRFQIWPDSSGDQNRLWYQDTTLVLANGVFTVNVGPLPDSVFQKPGRRWLGVKVLNSSFDQLRPLQEITGVPFVLRPNPLVQAGSWGADASSPGWTLDSAVFGPREYEVLVSFPLPYSVPPQVETALTHYDAWSGDTTGENQRIKVSATDISTTGFTLRFRTWAWSRVYGATATWIAIGR